MSSFRLIAFVALAGRLVCAADGPASPSTKLPPVLKNNEPPDSVMVTLPSMAPKVTKLPAPPPAPEKSPAPAPEAAAVAPTAPKPAPLSTKAFLPPDLQKESAMFCQKLIGEWTETDAEQLLGKALRQRPAYDEKKAINGKIYAFSDPSGRYRELELDFDQANGVLRTVFAYPKQMAWQECRRRWNGEVSEADARQGRTFYSYINRRLDVLVDAKGKVISLGFY
jgi:hypothetical protein